MIRIVGVHGVGKHRPSPAASAAQETSHEWKAALDANPHLPWEPTEVDLRVAYYADLLQPPGEQGPPGFEADAQRLFVEFLERLAPDPTEVKGTWAFREAAGEIAKLFGFSAEASMAFLGAFFPEVAAYLRHEGDFTPRREIMARVGSAIADADIVIAHSLGSIVAYETLWRYPTELPLLMTIGSPLALPLVFDYLTPQPKGGRGERPPGVARWINLSDHGDIVASPPGGIAESFAGVDQDLHDDIDSWSFHDEDQYLKSRQLGMALAEWNAEPAPN